MKLMVLILGAKSGQYPEIINNSLATWGSLRNKNIMVIPYYGSDNQKNELSNGELILATNDLHILTKTLMAFEIALKYLPHFDYLIRPNASTYVRLDKLYQFLLDKPRQKYYAGHKQTIEGITYASGTYMIYSRDIVQELVNNFEKIFEREWSDDWTIGKYLETNGYQIIDDIRQYPLIDNWPETELLEKMWKTTKEEFEPHIFFRCKTEISDPHQKRNDILKMNFLHKTLYL